GNCQTSDGCFIFNHLLDAQAEAKLVEHLVQRIADAQWHLDYGILGSKYVMNMLGEYGRTDVIYKMITHHDYPGYLYLVDHGCTTLVECWNLCGSHNHYMFSDISAVFYRYFAGILPLEDAPTYRRFELVPALDLPIASLSGSVESPHGQIVSGWSKQGDTIIYTAQIPFGTTALLKLPACVQAKENGTVLCSGSHTFHWKMCSTAQ
ncbi:MAG: alpha-L-rhamnosidase C-terminal domain-containing protein, partial [Ruthenibacterium sp.]